MKRKRKGYPRCLLLWLLPGLVSLFLTTSCVDSGAPEGPDIALTGSSSIRVLQHETYTDPGATALDGDGTDITSSLVVDNPVDTKTPGVYQVTFTCTNAAGLTASVQRTVTVDDVPEVLTGTMAFAEISGTADLTFTPLTGGVYQGTGRLRLAETDFSVVTALWDSQTRAVTAATEILDLGGEDTGLTVSGTFAAGVFTGTVILTRGLASMEGSISLVDTEPLAENPPVVTSYVGAYWGAAAGSWNITITNSVIHGTYWGGSAGVLTGNRTANAVVMMPDEHLSSSGQIDGDNIAGTWIYTDEEAVATGSWAGVRVNPATGDPVTALPVNPAHGKYLLILGQAMFPLDALAAAADYGAGIYEDPEIPGVSVTLSYNAEDEYEGSVFTFSGYVDPDYGFTINGTWASQGLPFAPVDVDVQIDITFNKDGEDTTLSGDFNVAGAAPPLTLSGDLSIDGAAVSFLYLEPWYADYCFEP